MKLQLLAEMGNKSSAEASTVRSLVGGSLLMSRKSAGPHGPRCLVPPALKSIIVGLVPSRLAHELKLPPGARFETLVPACVELADDHEERRLLEHLTTLAGPAINSWRLDLTALAFPEGVLSSINVAGLALYTRTRNCLAKKGLLSADALKHQSLEDLLQIPAFGVKCLVDLLTAVEAANLDAKGEAIRAEAGCVSPELETATTPLRLSPVAGLLTPCSPGDPYVRRSLVPPALKGFLKGAVPACLARDLELPRGARFETLLRALVEVRDRTEDRRLLDHLTELASPALTSPRLDLTAPAFPLGVASTIKFGHLPLNTRTRNCLVKEGLLSADVLKRQSLGDLLAIPAFGIKCVVDLLTAVEAANRAAEESAFPEEDVGVMRERQAPTLSPRLTREARLLSNEPWAKEVSLYDIRLGTRLLSDAESLKEVRLALAEGRIALEQRFCAKPPCRDLDLLRCPLLTYTKNRLRAARLTMLSAVASLTLREAVKRHILTQRALADLLTVLDVCRFPASAVGQGDHEPTLADFCEAVVNRTSDAWFPERLADRIHQTRALGIRCLSLPLEEELRDLTGSASPSRPEIAIEYLGWDGRGARSLASVGDSCGLSKERVRQLVAGLTDQLSTAPVWAPILRRALDRCGRVCPRPADAIAALLQQEELATTPFHPHGLLTAAEAFRVTHTFSLRRFGEMDWLFQGDEEALLRKCSQFARSAIAARGACSLGDLQAELGEQTGEDLAEDTLREWIDRLPAVCWLDGDRRWFRFRTLGSTLETILWKILAVAPQIQLGELRTGLTRHYRSSSAVPSAVLRQLCIQLGLQVDCDIVRVQQPIPAEEVSAQVEFTNAQKLRDYIAQCRPEDVLSEVEFTFFDILRAEGPLLPTIELEKRCMQRGMNQSTFWVYLTYSPILAQYASGVYGLRGARVAPGEAEALSPRPGRSRVVEDYGWKKGGVAWIAYTVTDGILRSGVAGMPAGMRDALGDGSWPLITVDGTRVGTLVSRGASVWGLSPLFHRRGADVGDVLVLEIDRKAATASVRIGGPELLEQARCDLPVTSELPDGN